MGHIPEDENFDEFMNASAEPEEAPKVPEISEESTDRWGSSTADKEVVDSGDRWGSEPLEPPKPKAQPKKDDVKNVEVKKEKSGLKWWIIAILVLVVLCICVCVTVVGLSYLGYNLIDPNLLQSLQF